MILRRARPPSAPSVGEDGCANTGVFGRRRPGFGAPGASDGPRGTSGWWSQCPWGRRRPLRSDLTPLPSNQPWRWTGAGLGGQSRPPLRMGGVTVCHSSGRGGRRCLGSGRFVKRPYGSICRRCHLTDLGGGRGRVWADRVVRPYEWVALPCAIHPGGVVGAWKNELRQRRMNCLAA